MGELNAPETLVPHNGGDAGAHPETQVIVMFGMPAGKFGHKLAHAGEHHAEPMVLRRDLHASREKVHHGMVAASMAELELLDVGAGGLAHHLVTQADAEHRHLAEQLLNLGIRARNRIGVAGAVA